MRITILYENHSGFSRGPLGAHGFSALVEHNGVKILVDTGTEGGVLLHNMDTLGIDPGEIDYVFLTHGHYDHTGGLRAFLEARGKPIKVVAHPEIFRRRVALKPKLREIGIPYGRKELEEIGAEFILKKEPFEFAPGLWSSGEIERRTWDRATGFIEGDGGWVRDDVPDDMALLVDLGESSVVITGCGHSGVLNIAWHSEDVLGRPVKALVGGLHLRGAEENILNDVAENLSSETVYAGHCTGIDSYAYLKARMGEQLRSLYTGKSFEI